MAHFNLSSERILPQSSDVKLPTPSCSTDTQEEYNDAVSVQVKLYRRSFKIKTQAAKEAYRSKRREVVKMSKLEKRRLEKQQFEELEFMRNRNQATKFYQNVNKQRKYDTPIFVKIEICFPKQR
uniref:Uncharacterized protein n=1 Tax=Megaselia scalaris TaxID=36166 RepID=T1GYT5_MEGSC